MGRWSEDCPEHQGVVVLSMNDTPLVSFEKNYVLLNTVLLFVVFVEKEVGLIEIY